MLGLVDEGLIESLVGAVTLPVNVMVGEGTPSFARLAQLGGARISHGPSSYLAAMRELQQAAAAIHA